ncbi:hypothetical protein BDV18DRAFT_125217 [Aspergillus unguis]
MYMSRRRDLGYALVNGTRSYGQYPRPSQLPRTRDPTPSYPSDRRADDTNVKPSPCVHIPRLCISSRHINQKHRLSMQ